LQPPKLFTPLQLGGITLANRIVVSPMCQYSADDGSMTDWHFAHLGTFACSGAGLLMVEATGVTREGRISHGCTGLYSDHNEAAMKRVLDACRRITRAPIGVQIGHAGRKGSTQRPWEGGQSLSASESPWRTVAPSAIAYDNTWHTPAELTSGEMSELRDAFAAMTKDEQFLKEADKIGLEVGLIRGEDLNRDIETTLRDKRMMDLYRMIGSAQ